MLGTEATSTNFIVFATGTVLVHGSSIYEHVIKFQHYFNFLSEKVNLVHFSFITYDNTFGIDMHKKKQETFIIVFILHKYLIQNNNNN